MEMTLPPSPYDIPHSEGEKPLFRRVGTWVLIVVFLLIAGQNSWFTEGISQSKQLADFKHTYDTSSPVLQVLTGIIYLLSMVIGLRYVRSILRVLIGQKGLLLFVALASLSCFWSQVPSTSFHALPLLYSMVILGCYIGLYYTPEDQIRIALTVGTILAISSALLAVGMPKYGLDADGEWKGVMGTKNQFGHAMLFLFSGILYRNDRRNRVFWTFAGLVGLLCLVMARSAESIMLAVILVAIRVYGPLLRRTPRHQQPFLLFLAASAVLVVTIGRVAVLDFFGKDTTLTGRTKEWATIWPFAMSHFWLGYGFRGFWTGTGDSLRVMQLVGGSMYGADSGYMDLLLQFGIVGTMIAIAIMLLAIYQFWRLYLAGRAPVVAYWYFSLVLISLIGNYADAYFPLTGGSPEIMLVLSFTMIWKMVVAAQPAPVLMMPRSRFAEATSY